MIIVLVVTLVFVYCINFLVVCKSPTLLAIFCVITEGGYRSSWGECGDFALHVLSFYHDICGYHGIACNAYESLAL